MRTFELDLKKTASRIIELHDEGLRVVGIVRKISEDLSSDQPYTRKLLASANTHARDFFYVFDDTSVDVSQHRHDLNVINKVWKALHKSFGDDRPELDEIHDVIAAMRRPHEDVITFVNDVRKIYEGSLDDVIRVLLRTGRGPQLNAREREILEERLDGASYRKIAARHKISIERTRQIVLKIQRRFFEFKKPQPQPLEPAKAETIFDVKVDELIDSFGNPLSVRSRNCLKNDNIVYIGDLVQKTEDEMLRTPNFGRKSLSEIREALAMHSLHLGMSIPDWVPPPMRLMDAIASI